MTKEQEIRAFALAIAEIKNHGEFCNVKSCEGGLIELSERQRHYLESIERYIADNNAWPISDDGTPFSMEIK
jgi:predicted RNA-binding protein with RPS1 domain